MEQHFRVEVATRGRGTVLALFGELDLASCVSLETELENLEGCELIVLDLRELDFIDSTGLQVLVKAHQRAQERKHEFALIRGGAQVQRLLDLTGLADRLPVADDPAELLG